jgi:hypothetical protein
MRIEPEEKLTLEEGIELVDFGRYAQVNSLVAKVDEETAQDGWVDLTKACNLIEGRSPGDQRTLLVTRTDLALDAA